MPIDLWIQDEVSLSAAMDAVALENLIQVGENVLALMGYPNAHLTVIIETDANVQSLNAQYRGIDRPTDVLSFAAEPLPENIGDESDANYLGDILIAYDYTLNQAQAQEHSPQDEFALMVVHGILHLLGYDHDTPESQQEMWQQQQALLDELGINIVVPDFVHGEDDEP
ncbi:MAG: rRNA maturation RNase YbeY [Phototrophicales bacterium]|nr:MAG: rRNA maturation RNase YbeY [Phototrophicales bacterium]